MQKLLIIITFISNIVFFPVIGQNKEIMPLAGNEILSLSSGNLTMIIDVSTGAKVVSLKLGSIEILGTKNEQPRYYGSTLWISPESKWRGQGFLDNDVYKVDKSTMSDLQVTSGNDTLRGFVFMKHFTAIPEDTSIIIRYIIKNISKDMQEVAPWEVTRVPTGGLAFIPKGSSKNIPTPNKPSPLLTIQDSIGTIWYPYDTTKLSSQKLYMDGGEGWMAYVHNNIVFIKKIPVITSGQAAPNEKNIEVYVNKEKTYIELENQGTYQKLAPGKSLYYEVKWYARRLPAGLNVKIGNKALLDYVRSVINKK